MVAERGHVPGSVPSEAPSPEISAENPISQRVVTQAEVFPGLENVGSPDYAALNETVRRERVRQSHIIDPTKASFYLGEHTLSLPEGFREPAPFVLNTEEWKKYSERRRAIEKRIEDATRASF